MYVVRYGDYWLRNTVWSYSAERASRFATEGEARAALDRARPFMRAAVYKAARVVLAD